MTTSGLSVKALAGFPSVSTDTIRARREVSGMTS